MPQVHNKTKLMDQDGCSFGKISRTGVSEASLRRIESVNGLEQKLNKISLNYLQRQADIQKRKHNRVRQRFLEKFHKTIAYKLVLKSHSITRAKDYKKALDGKYSFYSLRHEVKDMMEFIQPENIRERQARNLIVANRKRYDDLLNKNKEKMPTMFTDKKTTDVFRSSEFEETVKREDGEETDGRLFSKVMSLQEPKPVPCPIVKRQGITMSMMKRQKSFLNVQDYVGPRQINIKPLSNHQGNTKLPITEKIHEQRENTDVLKEEKSLKTLSKSQEQLPVSDTKNRLKARHSITLPPLKLKKFPSDRESLSSLL